jgi:RNA polymerase sigma factor (sigma-70 family)
MNIILTKNDNDDLTRKNQTVLQLVPSHQNFGLTKVEFEAVVDKLKQGDESLFERIFLSHFEDCISFLVKHYKVGYEIAYDIAMDTLIEFRQKLMSDKISYGNLKYLYTKIAGQIYLKSLAKENKIKNGISDAIENEDELEEKLTALKDAWSTMDADDRKLLENFYYLDIPLNKIAEVEKKTDSALRKQKQRAVEKLRQIFFTIYNKI